jgi:hypothetical protein
VAGPPNLAQYRLPATDQLVGEEFLLEFTGGDTLSISFPQPGAVRARWRDGHGGLGPYEAVAVRPGVFLIIPEVREPATDGLAVVVDRLGPVLAVVQHRLPRPGRDGTVVENVYLPGRLAGTGAEPPSPTLDLLGRWHRYRYSDANLYEHIYLSSDRFCSHNLATENTPGRADCHPVDHWRLADGLYLIAWRERGSGAAMTVIEDLQSLRITGSVLHPASAERSVTVPIGGLIEVVRGAATAAERGMRGEARGWELGDPISGGDRQPPRVNELT